MLRVAALHRYSQRNPTFFLLEKFDDGLATLENVLAIVSEDEPKDFEFIVDIETRIAAILRMQDRGEEADEIERRLKSVQEALEDEPELD